MTDSLCAAILAGGGSTRMGKDKSQLTLGSVTVLDHIAATLSLLTDNIVINRNGESYNGYVTIHDQFVDAGPLGGLHAVMHAREAEWFLVTACDAPFISDEVYRYLLSLRNNEDQAIVPVYKDRLQPMSAIFHKSVWEELVELLTLGERKMNKLFERIRVHYAEEYPEIETEVLDHHFFNMNTPEDYQTALKIHKKM